MYDLNKNSTIEDLSQVVPSDRGIQRHSWEGGIVKGFLELGEGWVECEEKAAEVNGFPSLIVRYWLLTRKEPLMSSESKWLITESPWWVGSRLLCLSVTNTIICCWRQKCVCVRVLSRVWLFVTPQTVVCQAPLSMGFSRQEYWSGLPFPSPGDPPNPGIKPTSLAFPALAGGFFHHCHLGSPDVILI